ncbi:MAG: hypothetical protein QOK05_2357 [Chloroflexota bacterium]|jgi:RNA polymerase sigma factor (sigma-70 family)|nr:hypothetical protein [Chloroflexota bacterium]
MTAFSDGTDVEVTSTERMEHAFHAHHVAVLRFCLSRLRDEHDAEDAVQEVFARAVRHQDEFVGDSLGWLIRTATNVCTDELRRRARFSAEGEGEDKEELEASSDDPETVVVRRMLISDLLGRLTPGERRVVADTWLFGPGDADRGSMGVQTSTTRVLLCRARRRMRSYLDDFQESASMLLLGMGRGKRTRGSAAEAWTGVLRVGVPGLVAATVMLSSTGPVPAAADAVGGNVRAGALVASAITPGATETPAQLHMSPAAAGGGTHVAPTVSPKPREVVLPTTPHQAVAQDAVMTDVQASPQYGRDHTILAAGTDRACPAPPCQALFASHDAGHTWSTLPAAGFASTQLLLPPASFASGHFFGFGAAGLQETTDGGKTFVTTLPDLVGFAATRPAGTGSLFSVSNAARWDFNGGNSPGLGSAFLPGWNAAGPAAFPGVGQEVLQPVLHASPVGFDVQVMHCAATCSDGPVLPWTENTIIVASPDVNTDHGVLAMNGSALALSTDGGLSFAHVSAPAGQHAITAQLVRSGKGIRIVAILVSAASTATLSYTDDSGASWHMPTGPFLRAGGYVLTRTDETGLIAAVPGTQQSQTAFSCSRDAGISWFPC